MKKILSTLILLLFTVPALSQTTVIFNVNLKPMLEDSSFISEQDILRITGDMYPLGQNQFIQLKDESPIDSIYTAEIRFSNRQANDVLEYNFQILKPNNEVQTELMKRRLQLRSNKMELPVIYFNAFAR